MSPIKDRGINRRGPARPRILAVIPARGGSKAVKRKNIRTVNGKPLIAYTIEAARRSRLIDFFVTSSDDAEILRIADHYKSPVIRRPKALAADHSPMVPVLFHALEEAEREGKLFDYVMVLQPTTPLRTSLHIDQALQLLISSRADAVVSVYRVEDHHPARMYTIRRNKLVPFVRGDMWKNRQELTPVFHRNGAIYAVKTSVLKKRKMLFTGRTVPYVMPKRVSLNIDDETDLKIAGIMIKEREGQ